MGFITALSVLFSSIPIAEMDVGAQFSYGRVILHPQHQYSRREAVITQGHEPFNLTRYVMSAL